MVYVSKQFKFTPDYDYLPSNKDVQICKGGTGYTDCGSFDDSFDAIYPDYELFGCDYAIGRITRGCIRNCPWCVVPGIDGREVRQVAELDDFLRGQDRLRLLDDNLLADPELFITTCEELTRRKTKVYFEALDIRPITKDTATALKNVRRDGSVHFAFDRPEHESAVRRGISALKAAGFPMSRVMFYVLVGFDTTPEEDMHRIKLLESLGVDPYVMPFDRDDVYQKHLTRWCNRPAARKSCEFENYTRWVKNRPTIGGNNE